jgi:putative ABC transport system permease protein
VRDWESFVRDRLRLPGLKPEREARIVRELAAQLEDFYQDARAEGASDEDADAYAARQVEDWDRFAHDVSRADRHHARPRLDRLADRLEPPGSPGTPGTPGHAGPLPFIGPLTFRRSFMLADLLRDVRLAIRSLAKAPGFALAAILTLALGVGSTSAIFSVVNGVVLRPMPYPDSESLVMVWEITPQSGQFSVAPANFFDWRRQATTFEALAALGNGDVTLQGPNGPEPVPAAFVSSEFFKVMGVRPAMGRGFTREEETPGHDDVIVISHGTWQRRFGADPRVLGSTVSMNGRQATIVGIMPPGFSFPSKAELWFPFAMDQAKATRGGHYLGVIGRIRQGVAHERAEAEMKAIAERLALQYPEQNAGESAMIVPLHEQVVGQARPALLTLLAAVAMTVLIACANVANLLLVRGAVRRKELAIRAALGASRGRLERQMLVESLVLAMAGGIIGIGLAQLAIRPLQALSAGTLPRVTEISIDLSVLGFAFGLSLLTGIVFGLAPAWQAASAALVDVLKDGGRGSTSSLGRWMRTGLLVAEVALSMVLLVGAALLLRSFANVTGIDPGFRPDGVLTFRVSLPNVTYPDGARRMTFYDALTTRLEALPGVRGAGLVQTLPLKGDYLLGFELKGKPQVRREDRPAANYRAISGRYFETLGIPLMRGRIFTDRDRDGAPLVAIVDEAFARRYFPGEDPIGRGNGSEGFAEIVGVVGSVRYDGLATTPRPMMYAPLAQDGFGGMWVVARTTGDPADLMADARHVVRALDPAMPAYSMNTLEDVISESIAPRRFPMLLLGLFAAIALGLAAVGLYGVVAYGVSLRTQEIGIRMAIGAGRGDVLRMIITGGMRVALIGVIAGIAGALALSRLLRTMLFGVTVVDPASYAATALMLLTVAALACYIPARRAMRLDPLSALRQD